MNIPVAIKQGTNSACERDEDNNIHSWIQFHCRPSEFGVQQKDWRQSIYSNNAENVKCEDFIVCNTVGNILRSID